jgi:hypothetical protein
MEEKSMHILLTEKIRRDGPTWNSARKWEDNIKTDLKDIGYMNVD